MRGGVTLVTAAILVAIFDTSLGIRCDREPEGRTAPKSPADNRFRLKISGNPDKYVPNESYTVTLEGEVGLQSAAKFTRFMISVESNEMLPFAHSPPVGEFSPTHDVYTRISERCPNAITESSPTVRKPDVHARWTAPPTGSGCVIFRAMVMELPNLWYMDDGPLSRVICEEVQENDDEQPKVVEPCCACDEAKYEVTFEGLWSRHTHPKDFPVNSWLTRFSDVIGASHTAAYRFWDYGKFASDGLQQVAERGATPRLESELKAQSEHIRTIIKARGISYPNVTGKTFAVFRVDRKHHLMSIVSMIDPSPDWIVGVSGLELCLRNCSWVDHKVLNLYPWDVGTDSGVTYISSDYPTLPKESIRRITSSFPNDPRSPFYDPSGDEMKPLARLHLTRQRLYEKSCDNESFGPNPRDENWTIYDTPDDCAVSEWNGWSPCSVTCGRGSRLRQRFYLDDNKADMKMCTQRLTSRATCYGEQQNCGNPRKAPEADPHCAMTDWGEWSDCSATCGLARRMRTRKYKLWQYRKRCEMMPGAQQLQQSDTCYDLPGCNGEEPYNPNQAEDPDCPMTEWSDWSPCNVTCGKGMSVRTRMLVPAEGFMGSKYAQCSKKNLMLMEFVGCDERLTCDMTPEEAREACKLKKEPGPCRGDVIRWFFDTFTESCQEFQYSCRGNSNNFLTREACEKTCMGYQDSEPTTVRPFNGLEAGSHVIDPSTTYGLPTMPRFTDVDDRYFSPIPGAVINCQVSNWTAWSPCDTTCGLGYKTRTRHIKVQPKNGGHACPKKLLKKKRCKVTACDEDSMKETDQNPTWGDPQTPKTRDGGSGSSGAGSNCEYSDWSEWTHCSMSCGPNAQQQRTRKIRKINSSGGPPCGDRLEMRECDLLPCTG